MKRIKPFTHWLLAIPFLLSACSSGPSRTASYEDRDVYVRAAQKELANWDHKADRMKTLRAADLKARIADARVELNRMELATEATWREHKVQYEHRVDRIQSTFASAE